MKQIKTLAILVVLAVLGADLAAAQGFLKRAKKAAQRGAERAVEREAERKADQAVTGMIGAAEDAVVCVFTDETCIEQARESGQPVVLTDDGGNPVNSDGAPVESVEDATLPATPGKGVWANYDFVRGDRVLFYEDYTNDRVGNFPRRFEFVGGNWEVVEWKGRRLLRNTGPRGSALMIPLPEALPERFTIETEFYMPHGNQRMVLLTQPPANRHFAYADFNFFQIGSAHGTGVDARESSLATSMNRDERISKGLVPIRIMVDDTYAKVYVGENRTANIPNAYLPRSEALFLENPYMADEENPIYLGPIRVSAGGLPLYDALQADGRVSTQGILFDTGRANIRPESTPVLNEIAEMLEDHAELRIRIVGHTDDTGSADTNQKLSEKRAESVREYLIKTEGIDGSRLEATGMGPSEPVADNATPEGRQQNRRVELVRLDG